MPTKEMFRPLKCFEVINEIHTTSLLRVMRSPITLLKKLASKGFKGLSPSRKEYNLLMSSSLSARASLICDTSDVSSSHAVFGYL